MVQKKGSLPKEANDSLSELLGKLGIARLWQGIYNESQRHYLSGLYKEEVVKGWCLSRLKASLRLNQ